MHVAIAGGNGFIGRELTRQLVDAGHDVAWLSFPPKRVDPPQGVEQYTFDPTDPDAPWSKFVARADAVVNLSGHPIASRWNRRVKELIRSSRLGTTRSLVGAIAATREAGRGPAVYVGATGIGIYGDSGDTVLAEDATTGGDWLADLAVEWERAAYGAERSGCRVVTLRNGLVLGDEGFLPRMAMPARLFLGGPIGNGKQWVPWVHHADIGGLYLHAILNPGLSGPVNACAPHPVRMLEFSAELCHVLHRPSWLEVPQFALRLVLGEVARYTVMSQRPTADKAIRSGYEFRYPELHDALVELLG